MPDNTASKVVSEIEQEETVIQAQVARLDERLDNLEIVLKRVLRIDPEEEAKDTGNKLPTKNSDLGRSLYNISGSLENRITRLANIINRVEL